MTATAPDGGATGSLAASGLANSAAIGRTAAPTHLTAFRTAAAPDGFDGVCQRYAWACSNAGGSRRLSTGEILALADQVNRGVNRSVRPTTDRALYRKQEHWTLPRSAAGDCEDYALLKKKQLLEAGVAANRLYLATAFNRRNEHHVVLILRTGKGDVVLDNLTNAIQPWRATGYTFVKMQNPSNKHRWDAILLGPRASRA